jgi:hypothetical protein
MMSARHCRDSVLLTLAAMVGFFVWQTWVDHGDKLVVETRIAAHDQRFSALDALIAERRKARDDQYTTLQQAIGSLVERMARVETIVQRIPDIDRKLDALLSQRRADRAAACVLEPLHIPPEL